MGDLILWSPTGNLQVRGPDDYAHEGGGYGANRTHGQTNGGRHVEANEPHVGVDLVNLPGAPLIYPCSATQWAVGLAYAGDPRFHSVHLKPLGFPDFDIKLLYIVPVFFHVPQEVEARAPMGISEDLRLRYPDTDGAGPRRAIINHVHLEVLHQGEHVDPTPLLRIAA